MQETYEGHLAKIYGIDEQLDFEQQSRDYESKLVEEALAEFPDARAEYEAARRGQDDSNAPALSPNLGDIRSSFGVADDMPAWLRPRGAASFSLAPVGFGTREIDRTPAVVSISADPFHGFQSKSKGEWVKQWKQWVSTHKEAWRVSIPLEEGDVKISRLTSEKMSMVKHKENLAHHYQAATMLPDLLRNSKLAVVEKPNDSKPNAAEIHKRYAWADFPDGSRKHVLMSVIRWKEGPDVDSAYSLETIEVREKRRTLSQVLTPQRPPLMPTLPPTRTTSHGSPPDSSRNIATRQPTRIPLQLAAPR